MRNLKLLPAFVLPIDTSTLHLKTPFLMFETFKPLHSSQTSAVLTSRPLCSWGRLPLSGLFSRASLASADICVYIELCY